MNTVVLRLETVFSISNIVLLKILETILNIAKYCYTENSLMTKNYSKY